MSYDLTTLLREFSVLLFLLNFSMKKIRGNSTEKWVIRKFPSRLTRDLTVIVLIFFFFSPSCWVVKFEDGGEALYP